LKSKSLSRKTGNDNVLRHRLLSEILGVALAAATLDCKSDPSEAAGERPAFARGDTVVVERAAAEFFQGRVLGVDARGLRVQTADEGDALQVAKGDAYRVPAIPASLDRGDLAVCNVRAAHWMACRIESLAGGSVGVRDENGRTYELGKQQILAPTDVTRMNIERAFSQSE
jgi:hypothetical protein